MKPGVCEARCGCIGCSTLLQLGTHTTGSNLVRKFSLDGSTDNIAEFFLLSKQPVIW